MVDSKVKAYLAQWLHTAGDFYEEYAWFQDRLRIHCRTCHAILAVTPPTASDIISWEIQDWVHKHRPDGPHDKEEVKNPMDVQPLTADFKSPLRYGKIDESASKAEIIKAQMEKYKQELDDLVQKKKVEWLQKSEAEKAEKAKEAAAQAEEKKSQVIAEMIQIMNDPKWTKPLPRKPFNSSEGTIPEPKSFTLVAKTKLKKIITGKKFR